MRKLPSAILGLVVVIVASVVAWLVLGAFIHRVELGGVGAIAATGVLLATLVAVGYRSLASRARHRRFEAYIAAHTHEVDDDDEDAIPDDPTRVRKQVYDLTPSEIRANPIWEHALDEEGIQGQDEATVRPRPDLEDADPREGLLIARSSFEAADGTRFTGYAYPSDDRDPGFVQPTIVTDDGQVNFWLGAHAAIGPDQLDPLYALLGKASDQLFTVSYRADVPTGPVSLDGIIRGFMWRTWQSDTLREAR